MECANCLSENLENSDIEFRGEEIGVSGYCMECGVWYFDATYKLDNVDSYTEDDEEDEE